MSDLPAKLGSPAKRALANAGIQHLEQLSGLTEAELLRLHGIGKNALEQLRAAMKAVGLEFAGERLNPVAVSRRKV